MKLAVWLQRNRVMPTEFAEEIGVSPSLIHKYLHKDTIPRPKLMQNIYEKTEGAVTANDFYDLQIDSHKIKQQNLCKKSQDKPFRYYNNFTKLFAHGRLYHFGKVQAKVIKQLYEASFTDAPWLVGKVLLYNAGSGSSCMRDLFKSQAHLQQLIESDQRGSYRLKLPASYKDSI